MTHNDKKKLAIQDINDLSRVFIEALKEISESGKSLTLEEFSKNLSQRKDVKNLIEGISLNGENMPVLEKEVEHLKTQIEAKDATQKKFFEKLDGLDTIIDREKDFKKRFSLTLLNMCQLTGNVAFFNLLDEYTHLVVEEFEIDRRAELLNNLKNLLLKSDIGESGITHKRSLLGNFLKRGKYKSLEKLKNVCLETLTKLQVILGEEYDPEYSCRLLASTSTILPNRDMR